MFEAILGNEFVKVYLQKAIREGKLPHALLFTGLEGIGKSLFAKELAAHLLHSTLERIEMETHPDFHVLRPEGKSGLHSIETMRHLIYDAHATPFQAAAKVFLIYDAHRMQVAAANAFLKTLEEPSSDTLFLLLTSAAQEILPTLISRCTILRFQGLSESEISSLLKKKGHPERFAKWAGGSAALAFKRASSPPIEESLFRLLSKRYTYLDLTLALQQIEKEIEDEDPLKENQKVEHLFAALLMWHRDQIAKRLGIAPFFPDAEASSSPLPDFALLEKRIEEARLAYSRNMRLSVCLEKIFSYPLT
jgi:DNA polymerase-3 subunit delta'